MVSDKRRFWATVTLTAAGILLTSAGHYLTPPSLVLWHDVFQRLYYLPIIFAALSMGWLGGLSAAGAAALVYIPHIIMTWGHSTHYARNQYAEIVVFFLVGGLTGLLADRERKRSRELEATAARLHTVYSELQDSFEQIKRADRLSAVGQLSAGLAHEIRNPLASIEGAADILQDESIEKERRDEFLGIIRKECRRLNQLLTSLLDFARPRQPELRTADAGRLLDSVTALAAPIAGKSGIHLTTQAPRQLPAVACDPEQIKQVLLNLTINAIQAMPQGGDITLAAEQQDNDIVIHVKDQGTGIPDEHLEKIFDPFFTTKEQGTGLGLSVAHQIVTQPQGSISVERNTQRGMTFSISLPIKDGGARAS